MRATLRRCPVIFLHRNHYLPNSDTASSPPYPSSSSSPFLLSSPSGCANIMSTDPGVPSGHQVRTTASPPTRELPDTRGGSSSESPSFSPYSQLQFSPPQPIDLDMEVYSPNGTQPGSPTAPEPPIAMEDDDQLGILSIPLFLSSSDSFDQQSNVVTSSLHNIADWLETVNWDAIFGRNPLDAATLNSNPLASAATRVIRYLNAGIAGRSPKVPELQVPSALPGRTTNPQQTPFQPMRPASVMSTRAGPTGKMTYVRAASRSSPAPSNNYTNWTVSRPSSQQSTAADESFVDDIGRAAYARPQRPRRVTLPRGARRAIHVVFMETKPDAVPSPAVVVQAVNSRLPASRREFQASSASWSSRNNVTIRFAQSPEDPEINAVRTALGVLFPYIPPSTYTVDKRHIISTVMFHRLALVYPDGSPITAEDYTQELKASPVWQNIHIPRTPRLVPDKDTHVGTLYVDFHDNGSLSALRHVMREATLLHGESVFPVKYHKRDTAPQCSICLRWGHSRPVCRSATYRCDHCGGNHSEQEHRQWAACCHGQDPTPPDTPCPHPPRCVNCGAAHKATDRACMFYVQRHDREWIYQHQPRAADHRPARNTSRPRNTRNGLGRSQGPAETRRVRFLLQPSASPADSLGPQRTPARALSSRQSQAIAGPSRLDYRST